MKNHKGFIIPLVIAIVILFIIGGGIYYVNHKSVIATPVVTEATAPVVVNTNTWQIYKNNTYGFSFKYPADWVLNATSSGATVLTKQHEAYNKTSLNGSTVDFSVYACRLSDPSCLSQKKSLDAEPRRTFDGSFVVDGVHGDQWVVGADQYDYTGVIESQGILYIFGTTPDEYETRYPASMSNAQVKAIFDSFRFGASTD